jgi:hypothetical protein
MKARIAGLALVLALGCTAYSYYPVECNPHHALTDFNKADVYAIGRVIGFERFSETEESKSKDKIKRYTTFSFYARIKLGRVVKGTVKEGSEILVFEGCYTQSEENNIEPVWVGQCNSHPPTGFAIGQSYILAVNAQPEPELKVNNKYSLRSCHHSLYPLIGCIDEKTEVRYTAIKLSNGSEKDPTYMPLEKFLERAKKDAGR